MNIDDQARASKGFRREIEQGYVMVEEEVKLATIEEWRICTLGELTDNFDAIRIPVRETDRRSGPYPYYGASGVVDYVNGFLFDGEYLLIAEDGENLRTRTTPIAFLANGQFWVNNHAHIIRGNSNADTRFLKYALAVLDISGYLTGSTMPKLTQGNMNRIPLFTPPLPEQHAIAHILGTLDDKIELNRRMNETLEELIRALFQSWFVDFDPVRAKMKGCWGFGESLPGLPTDLYHLFPDRFVSSELGDIPEGWRSGCFGDLTHQRKERVGDRKAEVLSAIASGELARSDDYFNKTVYSANISKYLAVEMWDIAYNPFRVNIGSVGMLKETILGAVSPVYVVARPLPAYRWYLEFSLKLASTKAWIEAFASGSVRQSLSYKDFAAIPCVIPPPTLVEQFDRAWEEIRKKSIDCSAESHTLTTIRESLLPKLVSGEIRV